MTQLGTLLPQWDITEPSLTMTNSLLKEPVGSTSKTMRALQLTTKETTSPKLSRILHWLRQTFGIPSRNDEQVQVLNQACIQQHLESDLPSSYSLQFEGSHSLTSEELSKIRKRSEDYARSLLQGCEEIPVDELSDIGLMCVVDIPRLIGTIEFLTKQPKETDQ